MTKIFGTVTPEMRRKMKLSEDILLACIDVFRNSETLDFIWIRKNTYFYDWLVKAKMLERENRELKKRLEKIERALR